MHRAVIFDFDGTMLDSYRTGMDRLERLLLQDGLTVTPEARQIMRQKTGHAGAEFLQLAFGIASERARRLYHAWECLDLEAPQPFIEGTRETLEWLRTRDYEICLLTMRHEGSVVPILEREDLLTFFTHLGVHENTTHHKPDGRAFTEILETLGKEGIVRNECLFVGDSLYDIEAGRSAGIRTVVVGTGPYHDEHHKTHKMPDDHIIDSIKHLPAWIEKELAKR